MLQITFLGYVGMCSQENRLLTCTTDSQPTTTAASRWSSNSDGWTVHATSTCDRPARVHASDFDQHSVGIYLGRTTTLHVRYARLTHTVPFHGHTALCCRCLLLGSEYRQTPRDNPPPGDETLPPYDKTAYI